MRCRRWWSASDPRCRPIPSPRASARSTTSAARTRSTSAASTRTRAARSSSRFFERYLRETPGQLTLVLIGHAVIDIPSHPRIRHVGFVDDTDKFDAIAGAELLIMPSYYESLSMVALEAWALGRPVLANAKCDVLMGQCLRSNAGLWYEGRTRVRRSDARARAQSLGGRQPGRNGRQFYRDHYDWPVIERKYLDMLRAAVEVRTVAAPSSRFPGGASDGGTRCPPAPGVVDALPFGPSAAGEPAAQRPGDLRCPRDRRAPARHGA